MRIVSMVANPCVSDGRVIKAAETLAQAGHQVRVVAFQTPEAPERELRNDVDYRRVPYPRDELFPLGLLARLLPRRSVVYRAVRLLTWGMMRYRWFEWQAQEAAMEWQPDLIHAHDLETLPAALAFAGRCGAAVIYDAHELETDRNPTPLAPMRWKIRSVMRRCVPRANVVITVGKGIEERLKHRYCLADVRTLYNVPRVKRSQRKLRHELNLPPDAYLVVSVGKVTLGRGVEPMIRSLVYAPKVHLAFVGPCEPSWAGRLAEAARHHGVAHRVHLVPPVPFDEVVDFISTADAGLLGVEPVVESYRLAMPNKLFEMAMAGLPILAPQLDEVAKVIQDNCLGAISDIGDPRRWADDLLRLLSEGNTRNGPTPEFVAKWGWHAQEQLLLRAVEDAVRSHRVRCRAP